MFRQLNYLLFLLPILFAMQAGPALADPTSQSVTTITIKGPTASSAAQTEKRAPCTRIQTATDLDNIRNDLGGNYCLANDIDASSIPNFTPIGDLGNLFTGTLDGRGHIISGLTINSTSGDADVGLIGAVDTAAVVKNIGLVDATVTSRGSHVGAITGWNFGTLTRSFVIGTVSSGGDGSFGGLVGVNFGTIMRSYARAAVVGRSSFTGGLVGENHGPIIDSHAHGPVRAPGGGYVGGLAGFNDDAITRSYATGSVTGSSDSFVGGLAGHNASSITQSYATGPVTSGGYSESGGLVGSTMGGSITQSYATGAVTVGGQSDTGGLVGFSFGGKITNSFATGPVRGGQDSFVGGLVGRNWSSIDRAYATGRVSGGGTRGGLIAIGGGGGTVIRAFWDVQTTGQGSSVGGAARTTAQLQAALPNGFPISYWGITPNVSYPYPKLAGLNFWSPLATIVLNQKIFVFLPISQLDTSQYAGNVTHQDKASLAAAYTVIARAIGITNNVATLKNVKINTYFWNDATQVATWKGPVINHATLGPLTAIPSAQPIRESNVIGPLRSDKVVIIRGVYTKAGGGAAYHWMLATSFIVDGVGAVTSLVADDPWTGQQVRIDPTSKAVTAPANFPLANFKVNGFQVVTLVGGAAPLLAEIR